MGRKGTEPSTKELLPEDDGKQTCRADTMGHLRGQTEHLRTQEEEIATVGGGGGKLSHNPKDCLTLQASRAQTPVLPFPLLHHCDVVSLEYAFNCSFSWFSSVSRFLPLFIPVFA